MKLKFVAIIAIALSAVTLTGCSSVATNAHTATKSHTVPTKVTSTHNTHLEYRTVKLPGGKKVNCVVYNDQEKGGVDCQWSDLNPEKTFTPMSNLKSSQESFGSGKKFYCVTYDGIVKGGVSCNF